MNFEDFSKYFAILGGKRKKIFFTRSAYKCIPENVFQCTWNKIFELILKA